MNELLFWKWAAIILFASGGCLVNGFMLCKLIDVLGLIIFGIKTKARLITTKTGSIVSAVFEYNGNEYTAVQTIFYKTRGSSGKGKAALAVIVFLVDIIMSVSKEFTKKKDGEAVTVVFNANKPEKAKILIFALYMEILYLILMLLLVGFIFGFFVYKAYSFDQSI